VIGTKFLMAGFGAAWSGSRWTAVGSDDLSLGGGNTILTSLDGLTWTSAGISGTVFTWAGTAVAWNGTRWVAVGYNLSNSNTILTSVDGLVWSVGLGSLFTSAGRGIAWNGLTWTAVGNDQTGTNAGIRTSTDGVTWSNVTGTSLPTYFSSVGTNTPFWKSVPTSDQEAISRILFAIYNLRGNVPI
jgi:hypothetical protein